MKEALGERTPWTARDAAAYIADMAADLARIARQHRLDALAYLLEMTQLEARQAAGRDPRCGREPHVN